MKLRRVKTFRSVLQVLAFIAPVLGLAVAPQPSYAQICRRDVYRMVGSWSVTIDVANPAGVPSFPVLMTFHADGTMLQSRLSYIPAYGALETTAHGGWKLTKQGQIAATTSALAQGAPGNTALNGAFIGTEKVNLQPVLSQDGNSFTAQWTSTVYDPNGNVLLQGNGTMSATRIQVEP